MDKHLNNVFFNGAANDSGDFDGLQLFLNSNIIHLSLSSLNLIDIEFYNEIKKIIEEGEAAIYFTKTMRHIKCVLQDDIQREHEINIHYKSPQKLSVLSVSLPFSPLQEKEYSTMEEIISDFKYFINDLATYLNELEKIDRYCTVMEPKNPSYKDDFRRILLDDRSWLHIEVTLDGLATNIHLVGQSERWQDKLQTGLLAWDHDKHIVENIMTVFDLTDFPVPTNYSNNLLMETESIDKPTCGICFSDELPDSGLPLPLCKNTNCGAFFHRTCLFEWLIACSGSRPPAFGVVTGVCPSPACLQQISCSEKDT